MLRHDLISAIRQKRSFLCVGLDTELSKLPEALPRNPEGALAFNQAIISATRGLCVAYKPNLAFYEAMGPSGWVVFEETLRFIGRDHFIIADAKRGDIGNTSRMYADAFFNKYGCDAVTVAPYMGADSVQPFLEFPGKWAIVLALTSNRGSGDFQQIAEEGSRETLYEKVLRRCQEWGRPDNLMFVVGATHPEAFEQVRRHAPDHFLLVPGVGAQGGDLQAICRYGLNADVGLLVNASRSILYASGGADFAAAARAEAEKMQQEMADILDTRWP
jgi:orotidine-5'-phosphate decarboxylase